MGLKKALQNAGGKYAGAMKNGPLWGRSIATMRGC
jgi:hypothetical protein